MSNEFYRAIAKRLVRFLKCANIKKGSRYWLRLDSQEMVDGIDAEVRALLEPAGNMGTYSFVNENGNQVYETYTLELANVSVVFAYQTSGMVTDFLAALRNDAREKERAIVTLTTEKSDTVDSATKLLSDPGMPFNEETLKQGVKDIVSGDDFPAGVRALLDFTLGRMEEDRFSDKSSVSGYETFLSIAERNTVVDSDFISFRMFPDHEALNLCPCLKDKKTVDRFIENSDFFGEIEKAFSRDEINEKLSEAYKREFVDMLQRKKAFDHDWREGLTYKQVKENRKKSPNDKIVELFEDATKVEIVDEEGFHIPVELFMKNEGESKAKRRKRHIIAFVPANAEELFLEFKTTSPVLKGHLDKNKDKRVDITPGQTRVQVQIKLDEGTTIASAIIQKNMLSIAAVRARTKFFEGIQTRFSVDTRKKSASILVDVEKGQFVINPRGSEACDETVTPSGQYSCYDETQLVLHVDDSELDDAPRNVTFDVTCDNSPIPISVKHDVRHIRSLDAVDIYREKLISKSSFKRLEDSRLQIGSYEYAIEDARLEKRLALERDMINSRCLSAKYTDGKLQRRSLSLSKRLDKAYQALLSWLSEEGIELSLAYTGDDRLKALLEECVDAYREAVGNIANGSYGYEDLLEIGVIYNNLESDEIWFTPLHPVNIAYQLNLLGTGEILRNDSLVDVALARLVHPQAVPYIYYGDKHFEVADITEAPEWAFYYELDSVKGRALGDKVARIVRERIEDFLNHFGFLFVDGGRKPLRIACYDLGTCEDILVGISEYLFGRLSKKDSDPDSIVSIHVDCYGDPVIYTAFENLLNKETLSSFLNEKGLLKKVSKYFSEYECLSLILGHLSFSLHLARAEKCYSHIAFIQGTSRAMPRADGKPGDLRTGIMLNGAICVASTTDSQGWFSTGFGTDAMEENGFSSLLMRVNALHASAYTQSGANDTVITAAISHEDERRFDAVYETSNWVVLLDPKVDPIHFVEEGSSSDRPLVIHYEDRESSNGYDAITVTKKTEQYVGVIAEALTGASHGNIGDNVRDVVDFANAFNGTWLLSFLESRGTQTPRSRMSMLAAVKASMAHYRKEDIIWVPLSLEETLRISTGLKRSAATEINSCKNLGFEVQPTSDDILLVGIMGGSSSPEVLLHPIEVKVGNCTENEIDKGSKQAKRTYDGFMGRYWAEECRGRLSTKIARNAFMQKVLTSAEKMKTYGIFPEEKWEWVISECRTALQNEGYSIIPSSQVNMPEGTVCAFSANKKHTEIENRGTIRVLFIPEDRIPEVTVASRDEVGAIARIHDFESQFISGAPIADLDIEADFGDGFEDETEGADDLAFADIPKNAADELDQDIESASDPVDEDRRDGIRILFGKDLSAGMDVIWEPCNTDKLFHTNTGIIGTMGTGKTQFTKSFISQLYARRHDNPGEGEIGILIFDYKGDYNESRTDFVQATNAKVLKPYRLPFNPLALTQTSVFKPLLPIHTANTFKDTLSKVYGLGPKQQDTLFQCIFDAYHKRGIRESDPKTWDEVAPTFEFAYSIYANDEGIKKTDSLAAAMNKLHQFQVFESNPDNTESLFDLLSGVVVVDLSGYDPDIQSLVIAITLDLFYSQMQAAGSSRLDGKYRQLTKLILVDEADNFLRQGFPSLKKILKEGREFGVGTILSTQFLKHFKLKDEDYSKYILTWVVHNVADLDPADIRFVFNTESKGSEEARLFSEVKKLKKHCSIVKMGDSNRPITMRDKAFFEYWAERNE